MNASNTTNTAKAPANSSSEAREMVDTTVVNKVLAQPDYQGQRKLQTMIEGKLMKQMLTPPANAGELANTALSFANDMGYSLNVDAKLKTSQIANSFNLKNRIKQLKADLKSDINELKHSSESYVKAAESAATWLKEAQRFVQKHPKIASLLHSAKK